MRLGIVESIPLVDSWAIVIKEFSIGLDLPLGLVIVPTLIAADMAT